MESVIIGIAGGTGSGKTTITNLLKSRFHDEVSIVYHDSYYKRHDELSFEEREKINYDSPDAFDTDVMIDDLKKLRKGEPIFSPVYDYALHNRTDKTQRVDPADVIIVEGILIFQNEELRNLMNIKIFVDTDADERLLRRILRDCGERKRSVESVAKQYRATVKPMHEKYVEPSKKFADIIVVGGGENLVALDMISTKVEKLLKNHE
ncbi:MAG: uridine kinase [Clostridia bacterium]|nr:uridine kinase [Clostridia bacterium]